MPEKNNRNSFNFMVNSSVGPKWPLSLGSNAFIEINIYKGNSQYYVTSPITVNVKNVLRFHLVVTERFLLNNHTSNYIEIYHET